MIAARQIAFGKGRKVKPYDAEIEFLESTGTQYIDTGMSIDTSSDVIRCTFLPFANTGTYETYFGVGEKIDGAKKFFEIRKNDNETRIIGLLPNALVINKASNTNFNADEAWHNLTYSAGELILDNYVNSFTPSPTAFSKSLYLFARHNLENDTPGIAADCRMSAFQHWRNGILVRDFIPVRKGNIGYMYDRVSGKLFGNQGTDEFVLGPDIIDYTAKDYIQDGLVAMWDGIENVGWGKHDNESTEWVDLIRGTVFSVTPPTSPDLILGFDESSMFAQGGLGTSQANMLPTDLGDKHSLEVGYYVASCGGIATGQTQSAIAAFYNQGYRISVSNTLQVSNYRYGVGTAPINKTIPFGTTTSSFVNNEKDFDFFCDGSMQKKITSDYVVSTSGLTMNLLELSYQHDWTPDTKMGINFIRIYNRALTAEEIAYNYSIDKARFGL